MKLHFYFICKIKLAHRCEKAGCGTVIVIDGNMKNHRSVCYATNAGYAEYDGLPGVIRTGCPNTPAYKSRYCSLHKPMLGEDAQSMQDQPGMIIGKRITRQGTSYEVSILMQIQFLQLLYIKYVIDNHCFK